MFAAANTVLGRSDFFAKPREQCRLGAIFCWLGGDLASILLERRRRRFGPHTPDVLHEGAAMLTQNALNAADGVAFAVGQVTDASQPLAVAWPLLGAAPSALPPAG